MSDPVHLDCNATPSIHLWVDGETSLYLRSHYGNLPSDPVYGRAAKAAVHQARVEGAARIHVRWLSNRQATDALIRAWQSLTK